MDYTQAVTGEVVLGANIRKGLWAQARDSTRGR